MNKYLPIKDKKIGILGAAKSGIAAANLAKQLKAKIFISDINNISENNLDKFPHELGNHSDKILECDIIIKSPGIPNDANILKKIIKSNIPIISEVEFASWFTNGYIIALTGTNGKTTTVNLINHILSGNNFISKLGGNVGIPFSVNVLDELKNKYNETIYHVLELSSFQLEDIKYFKPDISIILNISPDHLDHHKNFNNYLNSKIRISMNQDKKGYAIFNDNNLLDIHSNSKAKKIRFRVSNDNEFFINDKKISFYNLKKSFIGKHNYENILSAILVCKTLGLNDKQIINSINSFKQLEHRLELLNVKSDQLFYNDSKATNLNATCVAIESISSNIILILGGIDKNDSDFKILEKYKDKIVKIICYGESSEVIKKKLNGIYNIERIEKFEKAISKSLELANKDDCILLSPACASFDQFKNYEERGNCFKNIIKSVYEK